MTGPKVHPTAIVGANVQLGEDVLVGPYAVIEDDVSIGDRTRIDAHAVIKSYTTMGTDNHVHSHALVGGEPQDLKFQGEVTQLVIGNRNRIREFSTMHRGTQGGGGLTCIGDDNLLMAYTHIAHDCRLGSSIVMSNGATLAGHVTLGDFTIIGGLSAVHQFCRIGAHAFVGGMTGVAQDLPPWMLAAGSRALVHGPNLVGMRRAKLSTETIAAFKKAFRLIWRSATPRNEALDSLADEYADMPELLHWIDFIRSAERGICPAEKMDKKAEKDLDG